jgi:hypothetical protein
MPLEIIRFARVDRNKAQQRRLEYRAKLDSRAFMAWLLRGRAVEKNCDEPLVRAMRAPCGETNAPVFQGALHFRSRQRPRQGRSRDY